LGVLVINFLGRGLNNASQDPLRTLASFPQCKKRKQPRRMNELKMR
jgi:hypothetical protein